MAEHSTFPGLPTDNEPGIRPSRAPRICIASYEMVGPNRNGGIGTAYFSLASALAEAGHNVTVLYLQGKYSEDGSIEDWKSFYRKRGIELVPLLRDKVPTMPRVIW